MEPTKKGRGMCKKSWLGALNLSYPLNNCLDSVKKPIFRRSQNPILWQFQPALGMLVRCADGTRCSPFASALFCLWRPPEEQPPVHTKAFIS